VRGIRLGEGEAVISLIVAHDGTDILTATMNGYGKRTALEAYPVKGRGVRGVLSIKVSERNGKVIGAVAVKSGEHIMLISDKGTLVRTRVSEVRVMGRNTAGVRLMRVLEGEHLIGLESITVVDAGDNEDVVSPLLSDDAEE
jgi:DNA gyrase subunit A